MNHHWAELLPRQEAYGENCGLRDPKVCDTIGLCLNQPQEHSWLCVASPSGRDPAVCQSAVPSGDTLWSVLQHTEWSQGSSLAAASAETSLPYSRGCCRGIIIHIRDKMDPKPNLKWKQMQFQLT